MYGLENWVDFLSSAVVLWRFFAPHKLDPILEAKLARREKRAALAISFILVLLGIGVIATASEDIKAGGEPIEQIRVVEVISFFSILIFGTMAALKFRYAKALSSPSLRKDGICSLIGTILATALFVDTFIIDRHENLWWIDPLVALGAGIAAMLIGFHGMYVARCKERLPIFSCAWWFLSQGEETAGAGDDDVAKGGENELALTEKGSNDEENEDAIV